MADAAAARREARRRKITENAEARMNRLLGKPTQDTAVESTIQKAPSPVRESAQASGENKSPESSASSSPYNLRHRPQRSLDSKETDSPLSADPSHNQNKAFESQAWSPQVSSQETSSHLRQHASMSHSGATSGNRHSTSEESSQVSVPNDIKTWEWIHTLLCIITALIARLWLTYGTGFWYFQTIVLPFLVMELVFTYLSHTHFKHLGHPQHTGNMMSAALVLCGIKPELIDFYNTTMGQLLTSKTNFCIYLFCFFCWDSVIG